MTEAAAAAPSLPLGESIGNVEVHTMNDGLGGGNVGDFRQGSAELEKNPA